MRMPNYITYKQADSRWGSKNYNGSSSMATAGCGPTSVAMLAYAVDGKTNPWDVALYMKKHGYAVRNHGTAWDGIPAAMKAFGLQDVKKVNVSKSMDEVWNYLSKGYCAVFLFKAGSRGGITWTTSGHYVAVTDYKVDKGRHYLYTRDSGGRNHTGWYAYESTMRGLIPQVWVGKVTGETPKPTPEPFKPLAVDGQFGIMTKMRLQRWLGVTEDAEIGKNTIKALQKKVGANVDGEWGRATTRALQSYLTKQGFPVMVDGAFGKATIKALQKFLNKVVTK